MATISLKNVNKYYPNNVHAVTDFSIDIADKELIVFVGPSGCGKSTTLRMIAGLEEISSGELLIDNKLVNYLPPQERNVAMVFQNYALYPHMSVYGNMAYGIKIRKNFHPDYEDNPRVNELCKLVNNLKKELARIEKRFASHADDKSIVEEYDNTYKKIQDALAEIMSIRKPIIGIDEKRIKRLHDDIEAMEKENAYVDKFIAEENAREDKDEEFLKVLYQDKLNGENIINERQKELNEIEGKETEILFNRHLYKYEVDYEVYHAADILDLKHYLFRKPAALSGGQRQRVALGRAIVRRPKVFLMDEPLSNLDAKLRVQTRGEIARIHRRVGATTIYVTHDQTEAMTLASRIVIMKDGFVQQIDTPMNCFDYPNNIFVAGFIGSPSMNFIDGTYSNGKFKFKDCDFEITLDKNHEELLSKYEGVDLILGIRPENMIYNEKPLENDLKLNVDNVELLGNETVIYAYLDDENKLSIKVNKSLNNIQIGNECHFSLDLSKIHFFDKETTLRITK